MYLLSGGGLPLAEYYYLMTTYLNALYRHIPWYVFLVSVLLFALLTAVFYKRKGESLADSFKQAALLDYFFLVLFSTVFSRPARPEMEYVFTPFWKYWIAFRMLNMFGLFEIVMNIVLFVPIGYLAPTLLKSCRFIKNEFVRVLLFCMSLSVTIELLQLVLHRGMCETDDLTHNTLGTLIGYGLYRLVRKCRS